ncbi:MAG: hypothetical protein ACREAY_09155 [Nitrososphaera sp.]|uniref:hypothetical protein n=1 Tax=Nitrososphaera sp. TaxID=1971748 RepID=UPI003D6EFEDF
MRPFPAYRMLQGDARIWFFFTLYGLAAGAMTCAASFSGYWNMGVLAFAMNYPFFMAIFAILNGVSIPSLFSPAVIIALSGAVWSFIGLITYGFVRMFRLGP